METNIRAGLPLPFGKADGFTYWWRRAKEAEAKLIWRRIVATHDEILKHEKFLATNGDRIILTDLEFILDLPDYKWWMPLPSLEGLKDNQ